MKITSLTTKEKATLDTVAEGWEVVPTCYQQGFEVWLSDNFDRLLRQYGSEELSTEGF